jgi:hypothetical protein
VGKLTRHARMQSCTLRLPSCNGDQATTVFAHAPSVSKGTGIKSEDWFGAFACSSCHDLVDGRTPTHLTEAIINDAWLRGIHATQFIFHRDGLLSSVDDK